MIIIERILVNLNEVKGFFESFNIDKYAVDTETSSLRYDELEITGMSFYDGVNACYIPIESSLNKTSIKYIESKVLFDYLKTNVFIDECFNKTIVMHYAPFDGMVLGKYNVYFWKALKLLDTMVASHLIDENRKAKKLSNGLKQLTEEIFGIKPVKFDSVKNNHYSNKFFEYGMDDAINTWNLMMYFSKLLKKKGLMSLMLNIESDFQKVLIQMKLEGVLINKEFLKDTTLELIDFKFVIEKELYELLGEKYNIQKDLSGKLVKISGRYNFDSPLQLSKILFGKLGLEILEKTPTGLPKTGKVTMSKYKKDVPFVKKLNEYKICSKLLNGFFEPMPKFIQSDGKIRTDFHDARTVTGRLTSGGSQGNNMQQLPNAKKDFPIETRKCFIVSKGKKMIGCDFAGQESRIIAHLSSDKKLIKLFEGNGDFHLNTANSVFKLGIPLEALSANHSDNAKYKNKFKDERSKGKTFNFAVPYGTKAYGLSQGMNCSEEKAQTFLDNFFENHPGVKTAIEEAHKQVKEFGFVKTELGRYRHFEKNDKNYYDSGCFRQSFNMLIQGFASDMMRIAMNNVFKLGQEHPDWELKAILSIHDEGVYVVNEEFAEIAGEGIKKCFENSVKLKVPIKADISIGNNYSEAK